MISMINIDAVCCCCCCFWFIDPVLMSMKMIKKSLLSLNVYIELTFQKRENLLTNNKPLYIYARK